MLTGVTISLFERWPVHSWHNAGPQTHRCAGKQRVGQPQFLAHSPLLQHPCSQSPFQLCLYSGCLLLLIQTSFAISCTASPQPSLGLNSDTTTINLPLKKQAAGSGFCDLGEMLYEFSLFLQNSN